MAIKNFFFFWLHGVFVAGHGLFLAVAHKL